MRTEVKGLIAAVIAGTVVLGATFAVSAIVASRQPAHSGAPSAQVATSSASPTSSGFLIQGRAFFTESCVSCHGPNAAGAYGPSLHHERLVDAILTLKIKKGIGGKMPAFSGKYNDNQIQALVAYIRSLT